MVPVTQQAPTQPALSPLSAQYQITISPLRFVKEKLPFLRGLRNNWASSGPFVPGLEENGYFSLSLNRHEKLFYRSCETFQQHPSL